jgi:hypothetical protein
MASAVMRLALDDVYKLRLASFKFSKQIAEFYIKSKCGVPQCNGGRVPLTQLKRTNVSSVDSHFLCNGLLREPSRKTVSTHVLPY